MSGSETHPELDKIIAEYLERTQAGNAPDCQELLDQHPELVDGLKSFFASHEQIQQAAIERSRGTNFAAVTATRGRDR